MVRPQLKKDAEGRLFVRVTNLDHRALVDAVVAEDGGPGLSVDWSEARPTGGAGQIGINDRVHERWENWTAPVVEHPRSKEM